MSCPLPGLRVNIALDEIVRYSPRKVDVINLKTNTFETVDLKDLLKRHGKDIPGIEKIVSVCGAEHIRKPVGKDIAFNGEDLVVTFDGLIEDTDFIEDVKALMEVLEQQIGTPVDVEFAVEI